MPFSYFRQCYRKYRRPRLAQVARKSATVQVESPSKDRCRHVVFRESVDIRGRQQLRKAVSILRSRTENALRCEASNRRQCYT